MRQINESTIRSIIANQKERITLNDDVKEINERNMLRDRAIESDEDIEKLVKLINEHFVIQQKIVDMVGPFSDSNLKYAGFAIISAFNLSDVPFHKI